MWGGYIKGKCGEWILRVGFFKEIIVKKENYLYLLVFYIWDLMFIEGVYLSGEVL